MQAPSPRDRALPMTTRSWTVQPDSRIGCRPPMTASATAVSASWVCAPLAPGQSIGKHAQIPDAPALLHPQLLPPGNRPGQPAQRFLHKGSLAVGQPVGHHGQIQGAPAGRRCQLPEACDGPCQMGQGPGYICPLFLAQPIGHHGQMAGCPALGRIQQPDTEQPLRQMSQCGCNVWPLALAQPIGHHGQVPGRPAGLRRQLWNTQETAGQMVQRLPDPGPPPALLSPLVIMARLRAFQPVAGVSCRNRIRACAR